MRNFLLTNLFLLALFSSAVAQNNSAEAKAAYLLAEEEFNAGKYESAIAYLNQAAEKLGGGNAKIIYLKVLALQTLAEKDSEMLPALNQTINAFEKVADIESFNEEKKLEVFKLKLKTTRLLEALPKNALEIAALKHMKVSGWKLGMKLEELKEAEPVFFTKATRASTGDKEEYKGVYRNATHLTLTIKNSVLARMEAFSMDGRSDPKLMDEIKARIGANPIDTTFTKHERNPKNKTISRKIVWLNESVRAELEQNIFIIKGEPLNGTLFFTVTNDPLSN